MELPQQKHLVTPLQDSPVDARRRFPAKFQERSKTGTG